MERIIGVVGLGYVGLPIAVAFGRVQQVVGYDINELRVAALKEYRDWTGEVNLEDMKKANIIYTTDSSKLKQCNFIIVTVPTPIDKVKKPDLGPLIHATATVGSNLQHGTIVVYESTVYPGTTEEVCIPILEEKSGLKAGIDFFVGYSPERINPGDKVHTFENIVKVVSGQDETTLEVIANVYEQVVPAGVYRASSIKVAEAAKVIENTQRDLNIALMNELAVIFEKMGLRTSEVLEAAGTKWNFLPFRPGLVGGHCIGVDPYYLTFKAEELGYHPQVILAGRRINDGMGKYVAEQAVKRLSRAGKHLSESRVGILGLTFKEDVPDLRNSRVPDIVAELGEYGLQAMVHDPLSDPQEALEEYGIQLVDWEDLKDLDAVILAVAHKEYRKLEPRQLTAKLKKGSPGVIIDVKSVFKEGDFPEHVSYWSL